MAKGKRNRSRAGEGAARDPEKKKRRGARIREMLGILHRQGVARKGLTPERLCAVLEALGPT